MTTERMTGESETRDAAPPTLDPTRLKALAHPLRIRILNALSTYGSATASGLASRFGESSGATSYHLRQLERHGFVREDEGLGTTRERYWAAVPADFAIDSSAYPAASAERAAADAFAGEMQRQSAELLGDFLRNGPELLPEEWNDAGLIRKATAVLTLGQLRALADELSEVVTRHVDRSRESGVEGGRHVRIEVDVFPIVEREGTVR